MTGARLLIAKINTVIVNPIIEFLFALALLLFFWGAAMFILKSSDQEGREKGKRHMLWGLVGMFIMVAVFGILRLIVDSFGITVPK